MQGFNFFDFIMEGGYELLFPEEEDGDEEVEWVDKKQGIFKCPDCRKRLNV